MAVSAQERADLLSQLPQTPLKQPAVGKVCPKVYPNKAEPHEVPDKGALRCVTLAYP